MEDIVLTLIRVACGLFFTFSGFHKLFNTKRHATMLATLRDDRIPFPLFNSWFVSSVEFLGGLAVLVGFAVPLAGLGLLVICAVACLADGRKRVDGYGPIDWADRVDDWLYLPEVLYGFMLVLSVVTWPQPWSIDRLLLELLV